jgi:hypothetical protein
MTNFRTLNVPYSEFNDEVLRLFKADCGALRNYIASSHASLLRRKMLRNYGREDGAVCFCGAHRVQQRGVPTALIYIRV